MISRRHFLTLGAASFAAASGALEAFAIEPRFSLGVKTWTVGHESWPKGWPPLRIGVLTDIHAVEPWMPASRIAAIAELMNALRPDVIVLLGDYVNALRPGYFSSVVPVSAWTAPLKNLRSRLGTYAVLGNHDWWSGEVPAIRRAFREAGIRLLENEAVEIDRGGNAFWIAGLGDQLAFRTAGADNLNGLLRQISGTAPAILLAHEPDIFRRVPQRIALTLAGHTHGGQVYIPLVGRPALYRLYRGRNRQYSYGHVHEQGRQMIVSSGLGLSNYPVRFLVPPEIVSVTLTHPQSLAET
jgi:uncharacterized protein